MNIAQDHDVGTADGELHPIQVDHRQLGSASDRLEGVLADLAGGQAAGGASQVAAMLDEFRRHLLAHLQREEETRILEEAASAEPRLARRVDALLQEHERLRAEVTSLAALTVSVSTGPDWTSVHAEFVGFRGRLAIHEEAENEILASAYLEDIGGHN